MAFAALLMFASFASAQPAAAPLAGRPANFSHLVGRFKVAASVTPTEVVVEDPLTLRVVITGDGEPPSRNNLRLFPDDLAASFFVEPFPDEDVAHPEKKSWEFVWKLRPKSTDVREVPSLALVYYSPQVRRYQTARSETLAIDVKPRPTLHVETPLPADLPASFFTLAEWPTEGVARAEPPGPDWLLVSVLVALIVWTLSSPVVADVHALDSPGKSFAKLTSHPETVLDVVAEYFRRDLHAPVGELTAGDVDLLLKRAGAPRTVRARWQSWWRDADARRFASATNDIAALAPEAKDLIAETQGAILPPRQKPGVVSVAAPYLVLASVIGMTVLRFVTASSPPSSPSNAPPSWDAAREAFQAGVANQRNDRPFREDFARAAVEFQKSGHYAACRANLGNARFLAGQLPNAVAAFRAGFRDDPTNESVRRRLEFVRKQFAVPTTLVRPALPWAWNAPSSWLSVANALGFMTAAIVLPLAIRGRKPRSIALGCAAAFVGFAALGIALWQHAAIDDERSESIAVVRDDAPLRLGNSDRYETHPGVPILPRGYEVRVLDNRGDWLHVECPGGATGWLPKASTTNGEPGASATGGTRIPQPESSPHATASSPPQKWDAASSGR